MAGKAGGRKLVSPADMNVRPMMEVVRAAVFNILQVLHLLFLTKFLFN
jgi:16S rRNA G966 N2-methylase RsmD